MDWQPLLIRRRDEHIESLHNATGFWPFIVVMLIVLAFAVRIFEPDLSSGVSPSVSPTPVASDIRQPRVYTISYLAGVFSPTNLRIHTGDTVRFRNDSFFAIRIISDPHPQHNQLPGLDSKGDIPQDSYFAYTFSEVGIFGYHNEKNHDETGTIIVR